MSIKPFKNIEEVRALIGTGRRVKWNKKSPQSSDNDNLIILAIGNTSVFVSNEGGLEFTIPRYSILNYYGVEVPDKYVYVNVYKNRGDERPYCVSSSSYSRAEADLNAANERVGCLKIKLEERFDE